MIFIFIHSVASRQSEKGLVVGLNCTCRLKISWLSGRAFIIMTEKSQKNIRDVVQFTN